jgi:type II secretory ATPase GspE/PulE/Tfp pilus assembly ATPase PilB-like protein/GAF domain-containing protein
MRLEALRTIDVLPPGAAPGDVAVANLRDKLVLSERLRHLTTRIHAAEDLRAILAAATEEMLALFDVERLCIYAVDPERRELVSEALDPSALTELKEIRVPIEATSVAGFVALNRITVRVRDAYDEQELTAISPKLRFDSSWDQKTGLRTRQILAVPLFSPSKTTTGVLQLLNLRTRPSFAREDEERLRDLAETLGLALWRQSQKTQRPLKRRGRFDLLVLEGKITQADLDQATADAERDKRPLEFVLMEKHKVAKKDVGRALSQHYGCPFFADDAGVAIAPEAVAGIKISYLKANFWVPLSVDPEQVEILIDDPHSAAKLQDVRRIFPGKAVRCVVALRSDIYRMLQQIGGNGSTAPGASGAIGDILGTLASEEPKAAVEDVRIEDEVVDESSNAIIRLANQIVVDAHRQRASDIHIEPRPGRQDAVVRIRVDGLCRDFLKVPAAYRQALSARFKVMARLDIAERRLPQDGKIRLRLDSGEIELRVATIPTVGLENEDVVLRILTAQGALPLENLAMTERNLREFRSILDKPYGIFLCVGPTGSGKTTTLHAGLGAINKPDTKIWTVEDPVEITQDGLRQVQVNPKAGLTFPSALRSLLRADPDVIMIGEMRDQETATIAVEASLTGHLVLSTLHTNSAAETVTRLLEMGIDPFTFADSILGVIGQRLVRTICQDCKERVPAAPEAWDELARGYGEASFAALGVSRDGLELTRGKGCDRCNQTGYRGRTAIHELLVATDEVKALLRRRAPAAEIHEIAKSQGMTTLLQDGILKILSGHTDRAQVWATAMR